MLVKTGSFDHSSPEVIQFVNTGLIDQTTC